MKTLGIIIFVMASLCPLYSQTPEYGTFTDSRDKHVYKWVKIGQQTWMAENLAWLPKVSPGKKFSETGKHYYVYGYQGKDKNIAKKYDGNFIKYGVLYNWPAVMKGASSSNLQPSGVRGVCPKGWHVPSDAEWTILTNFLTNNGYGFEGSGDDIAKSLAATTDWSSTDHLEAIGYNREGNNKSGFTALPGANGGYPGTFNGIKQNAFFWSATAQDSELAWYRYLTYHQGIVKRIAYYKSAGCSVRCLKDE